MDRRHRDLRLVDVNLRLAWRDARLATVAQALFVDAPAGSSPGVHFDLGRTGAGYYVQTPSGRAPVRPTLGALFQDAELAVTEAALEGLRHRYLPIHAAAISRWGGGLLIIGEHDAGKTSLACALAQAGAVLLSDEVAPVQPATLAVVPFPRDVIVHAGTQRDLAPLPASPGFKCFAGYRYLPPSALCSGVAAADEPVALRGLLFPQRSDSSRPVVQTQGPAESARMLLQQSFDLAGLGGRQVTDCVQRLAQLPAAQVKFHSAARVVEAVHAWWRHL